MGTPVGPAERDPDDPDLWEEWYESEEDDDLAPRSVPWPYRLVALIALIGVVALLVFAR